MINKLAGTATVLVLWAVSVVAAPIIVTCVVARALREVWR